MVIHGIPLLSTAKPTIGLLINSCSGPQTTHLWSGVVDAAKEHDVNTITFSRGQYAALEENARDHEILYELVSNKRLDGLIVACTIPAVASDIESIRQFFAQYAPLPIITYGKVLDEIPGVMVDNFQGVRGTIQHLIEHHNYQNIAFVNGIGNTYDRDERCRAYINTLQEYGIPLKQELIIQPDEWQSGKSTIDLFIRERGITPDAIVASNDRTAFSIIEALHDYGFHVPNDVAVIGFDNIRQSQITTPSLTTVPLHAYQRGHRAVEVILDLIAGREALERVLTPTRAIVRESCGCLTPSIIQKIHTSHSTTVSTAKPTYVGSAQVEDTLDKVQHERPNIHQALMRVAPETKHTTRWVDQLLDALITDLKSKMDKHAPASYLMQLDDMLYHVAETGSNPTDLQNMQSVLRSMVMPMINDPIIASYLDDIWHHARILISDRTQRNIGHLSWQAEQRAASLHRLRQRIAATSGLPQMMDAVADELPHYQIPGCLIALFDSTFPPISDARLLLAYRNGEGCIISNGQQFPAINLVPQEMLAEKPATNYVVEPLQFQNEQLGFVLFEMGPQYGNLYDTLARQLGSAIQVTLLMQRNLELYQDAVQAQMRAEKANQLKSRFLTMVSHEIRTPLALLTGLSEMLLNEDGKQNADLPEVYREDLSRIYFGAQQLDGLMRDVMDLALSQVGQLQFLKKQLNPNEILNAVSAAGEQMAREKGLDWQANIPPTLPAIQGDRIRLQQVVLNLISNAVKFTAQGEIQLTATASEDVITILVSDTGIGIPEEEREAIFDEFHQPQSTIQRGFGGLGLGLAVCRQIVHLHGGQIGVRSSEEDFGSTFYFTLPIASALPDDNQIVIDASKKRANVVLLLSANPSNLKKLNQYLIHQGYFVESAAIDPSQWDTSTQWLSDVFRMPPYAIILDVQPESAWGWELLTLLKEDAITQDIRVMFYSWLQGKHNGAVLNLNILPKPAGMAALASALDRYGLDPETKSEEPTILIVDDDHGILDMHAAVVSRQLPESRILLARNGRQALDILNQQKVDLMLLDLMMPEMDGFAVLETMHDHELMRITPVIVMTAQTLTEEDMTRLNYGVATVLGKGMFTMEETFEHITQVLDHNHAMHDITQRITRKGMAYIHTHYAESITREHIADHVGVSMGHLTRCFRQKMGITPMTYIKRYRINKAKELLTMTDSITEIASAVGYSESSYFARVFRQEVGMSPRAYRQQKS